jgi:hypothetical protein
MLDRNNQLELDLMDKDDEIEALKQKLDQLELKLIEQKHKDDETKEEKLTLHLKRNSSSFGCFDIDELTNASHHHDDILFCQPSGAHDSALPDLNNNQFLFRQDSDEEAEEGEGDDGSQQQESYETEPFEELVPSYIHQALLSKLSSARVRLELDDLIVKYEASPDLIFRALAKSFIDWVGSVLKQQSAEMSPSKLFMTKIQSGIAGFWQEILSYFAHDNDGQYNLLHDIEENIEIDQDEPVTMATTATTETAATTTSWRKMIADHFDHLVLMLYKHHIIDDEAVVSWWNKPLNNTISKKIRNITHRFVEWIEDSEEEDDSEDDDSEDDQQDDQENDHPQQDEEEDEEDYVDDFDEEEDFDDLDITMSPPHADDPSTSGDDTDNGYEHAAMLDNHSLHTMLNDLLIDNDYCICQFNNTNNNAIRTPELRSFAPQDELHNIKCLCDYNNTPTNPVAEKKKKTVRIAM